MVLTVIVFIIVLSVLIFVHELGHFITAKRAGMKVEEFGFGFPPRIWGTKKGGTNYSINWIPFGGFVKILGEDGEKRNDSRSFSSKSAWKRVIVLAAGVVMNILLAFILLVFVNAVGLRVGFSDNDMPNNAKNIMVQIVEVVDGSPAQKAGLNVLDQIKGITVNGTETAITQVGQVQSIVSSNEGKNIVVDIQRGNQQIAVNITPRENPPAGQGAIGISLAMTGVIKYPWYRAIYQGGSDTWEIFKETAIGYATIIKNVFTTGRPGVQLSGPVGIAVITGQAERLGFAYLLQFMALISINLAVLNFIPFPALDGGRVLFIIIEKLKGSPIPRHVEMAVNTFGFALLILLMIYVTTKDILRFF
jgi:regulator of sigma E protease